MTNALEPGHGPRRILIVEDDPDIRSAVADLLELEGYLCTSVSNSREGLVLQSQAPSSLILLDYMMPEMNGGDFCSVLRSQGDMTPILFFSADREIERKTKDFPRSGVLKKPFRMEELLAAIDRLCKEPSSVV